MPEPPAPTPAFAAARTRLGLIALLFALAAVGWWWTVDEMHVTAAILLTLGVLLMVAPDTVPGLTIPGGGAMPHMEQMSP